MSKKMKPDQPIIQVKNLTKQFGSFKAVDSISFQVNKGEIFGFLGANGAGKTTAMKMLTGLLMPSSGKASVAGYDVYKQTHQIRKHIGYMSQRFSLYEDLSIHENIEFFGGIYGIRSKTLKSKEEKILSDIGLQTGKNEMVGSLPLGWKQKLAFSVALMHDPLVIFLDEPTSGVDPITRRQFWYMIYKAASNGKTLFITTHYMDEAEYCDRISIMVDGKIAAMDTPAKLKESFETISIDEIFLKLARPQNVK